MSEWNINLVVICIKVVLVNAAVSRSASQCHAWSMDSETEMSWALQHQLNTFLQLCGISHEKNDLQAAHKGEWTHVITAIFNGLFGQRDKIVKMALGWLRSEYKSTHVAASVSFYIISKHQEAHTMILTPPCPELFLSFNQVHPGCFFFFFYFMFSTKV